MLGLATRQPSLHKIHMSPAFESSHQCRGLWSLAGDMSGGGALALAKAKGSSGQEANNPMYVCMYVFVLKLEWVAVTNDQGFIMFTISSKRFT